MKTFVLPRNYVSTVLQPFEAEQEKKSGNESYEWETTEVIHRYSSK